MTSAPTALDSGETRTRPASVWLVYYLLSPTSHLAVGPPFGYYPNGHDSIPGPAPTGPYHAPAAKAKPATSRGHGAPRRSFQGGGWVRYALAAQLLRRCSDACSGTAGVLAGVGAAVARDTNPYMSGFAAGSQWFTLGYSYWCTSLSGASMHHAAPSSQRTSSRPDGSDKVLGRRGTHDIRRQNHGQCHGRFGGRCSHGLDAYAFPPPVAVGESLKQLQVALPRSCHP